MKEIRVKKEYGTHFALDVSLSVSEGEIVAVMGESGSGKTTLLNAVAGLIPFDGTIEKNGGRTAYVFQESRLLPNLTVAENLEYVGGTPDEIERALKDSEIWEKRNTRPRFLSGGERQRAQLARAFLFPSEWMLLDEPFSLLDTARKIRLIGVFARLWEKTKPSTLFITHSVEEACMLAHRVVVLQRGKIVYETALSHSSFPSPYGEETDEKRRLVEFLLKNDTK